MSRPLIRNMGASDRLEAFLVSAVLAVLGIRLYLDLSGYPRVGGDTLHIAHMLWGGLLMLVAIVLLLSFLGRAIQWTGAIVGGLGFGTFIDEVGKFVTRDNDYFYRPAFAIMYVVFVLTYLGIRRILTHRSYTREEHLVNALQEMEEIALHDLDAEERTRALRHLDAADPDHPLVVPVRRILEGSALVPSGAPPLTLRIKRRLRGLYARIVALPGFTRALVLFFAIQMAVKLYQGVAVALVFGLGKPGAQDLRLVGGVFRRLEELPAAGWGELFASLLATILTLVGMVRLPRSRLAAYYWFQRSILVAILLLQVFVFYREQASAVLGLLFNISLLVVLDLVIHEERRLERGGLI